MARYGGDTFRAQWDKYGIGTAATNQASRLVNNKLFDLIEDLNLVFSNMIRFASFVTSIEKDGGLGVATKAQIDEASRISKHVAVDYSLKGEHSNNLNALYLFWKAAINGTAPILRSFTTAPHRKQVWGAISMLVGIGIMSAMLGDDDDDGLIDETLEQRNLIFTFGDTRIQIPVQYGFSTFVDIGRSIARGMSGERSGMRTAMDIADSIMANFVPFGSPIDAGDVDSMDVTIKFMPTIAKPLVMSGMNRNEFASKIVPTRGDFDETPDRLLMYRATRGSAFDSTAQGLAWLGADISPETLKMATRYLTGGAGIFVADSVALTAKVATGKARDINIEAVPIVNKIIRTNDVDEYRGRMYDQANRVDEVVRTHNAMKKYDPSGAAAYQKENAKLIGLSHTAKAARDTIKRLRDQEDKARADGKPVGLYEQQQINKGKEFNKAYRDAGGGD